VRELQPTDASPFQYYNQLHQVSGLDVLLYPHHYLANRCTSLGGAVRHAHAFWSPLTNGPCIKALSYSSCHSCLWSAYAVCMYAYASGIDGREMSFLGLPCLSRRCHDGGWLAAEIEIHMYRHIHGFRRRHVIVIWGSPEVQKK
jgi:hypothetical protein